MVSPVPKHLRTRAEVSAVPKEFRKHVVDVFPDSSNGVRVVGAKHPAKFAPGLATELVEIAGTRDVGDPFAGVGTLARETGIPAALNDLDPNMKPFLRELKKSLGCEVSSTSAERVPWRRRALIFSPPYYPRTDRKKPNAHDDAKRGPVVGFRDSYGVNHPDFVGEPGGVDAILAYREKMTSIYAALTDVGSKMIVVTKNWVRLDVELRLDLDTILMAEASGWRIAARHGWRPPPSLWARFNAARSKTVDVEDILVFEKVKK